MVDRTGPSESSLLCCCINTTAVLCITLRFMTLGVWHKRDSGIAGRGAKSSGDFLKRESSKVIKSEERYPILVSKCGVPSQRRDFRNDANEILIFIAHTHDDCNGVNVHPASNGPTYFFQCVRYSVPHTPICVGRSVPPMPFHVSDSYL